MEGRSQFHGVEGECGRGWKVFEIFSLMEVYYMEVRFVIDRSSRLQVVADAAMNIASSVDRRASAYIDALWIQKKAEDQLSKVRIRRLHPFM